MSTDITTATETQLPKVYEAAKQALATCAKVDECKRWADKSAAIASYAKQAEDDTLLKHARKIQVRAWKRMGALLNEVEPGQGARDGKRAEGDHRPLNRTEVARDAGLSEHQQKTATRVGRVPDDEFERLVESNDPPTVTQLAEIGTKKRRMQDALNEALGDRAPEDVRRTGPVVGALNRLHEAISKQSPKVIARGLMDHEIDPVIDHASKVEDWLNDLIYVDLKARAPDERSDIKRDLHIAKSSVRGTLYNLRGVTRSLERLQSLDVIPAPDAERWAESLRDSIPLINSLRCELLRIANGAAEVEVEVEAAKGDGNRTVASV